MIDDNYKIQPGYYKLDYKLTQEQQKASDFVLNNVVGKNNCAVNAVCGAGKTEIIYDSLKYCLNNKLKVGIAIPRKDVVIELKNRIEKDFNVCVVGVYGGNHSLLAGDIIIFTTHQAFRYIGYFDVLIIDEVDAFPYNNNEVLKEIISRCSKVFVYLSATMPKYIEKNKGINKYYLNKRYHGCDLPIPKCKECLNMLWRLKRVLKKYKDKIVLVYFPTINIEKQIAKKIKCDYLINSKMDERNEVLNKVRRLDKGLVFTTTVLERGITIKDVQVIVYNADHILFNRDTLIQISGRVGRHKSYCSGDIIFICKRKNKAIKAAIRALKKCNE
jgi:competence protein ComFA